MEEQVRLTIECDTYSETIAQLIKSLDEFHWNQDITVTIDIGDGFYKLVFTEGCITKVEDMSTWGTRWSSDD